MPKIVQAAGPKVYCMNRGTEMDTGKGMSRLTLSALHAKYLSTLCYAAEC